MIHFEGGPLHGEERDLVIETNTWEGIYEEGGVVWPVTYQRRGHGPEPDTFEHVETHQPFRRPPVHAVAGSVHVDAEALAQRPDLQQEITNRLLGAEGDRIASLFPSMPVRAGPIAYSREGGGWTPPSRWQRARARIESRLHRLRYAVGCWIAGIDTTDLED